MESSATSSNASEPPPHRWARIMGTAIAILTLALPLWVIAYYSSEVRVDSLPGNTYSLPTTGD